MGVRPLLLLALLAAGCEEIPKATQERREDRDWEERVSQAREYAERAKKGATAQAEREPKKQRTRKRPARKPPAPPAE